jgi:hypothetical protein
MTRGADTSPPTFIGSAWTSDNAAVVGVTGFFVEEGETFVADRLSSGFEPDSVREHATNATKMMNRAVLSMRSL